MARFLVVCVGGFLGTGSRYGLNGWVAHRFGETFPWGTLTVNVAGSFAGDALARAIWLPR